MLEFQWRKSLPKRSLAIEPQNIPNLRNRSTKDDLDIIYTTDALNI